MSNFTGTRALTSFALRRDRVILPVWVTVIVISVVSSALATVGLYPTLQSRIEASSAVNNTPALVALYGRVWDPASLGALTIMKLSAFGAALIAVFAVILVVRHTRAEEENGRLELIGATVVGRRAALSAALVVAIGAMTVIGALTALGQIAAGLPAAGSWAFGMAWATTGIAFASVAAVTAQLTVTARSATGWAVAAIGVSYALRAIGDSLGGEGGPGFWSWMSPIGWSQQVRPYAGDRYGMLVLPILFSVASLAVAYTLAARRDLGAGIFADRPGPARATSWLDSPLGLAWRLQRGALLGWAVGYVFMGFVVGNIASNVGSMLQSPQARELIQRMGGTGDLTDAFLAAEFAIAAVATAAYGIAATMHLHSEEQTGRTELVLATAVSRPRWLASHVMVAMCGATLLSLLMGTSAGIAHGIATDSMDELPAVIAACLVYLPAIWFFTALVVLLFGVVPRLTTLAWAALVAFLLFGELGVLLKLPTWVLELSPFSHVPQLPAAAMRWTPVIALCALALVLAVIGGRAFARRDLDTA